MNNIIIEKNVSFNNIKTINYYNNDDYNLWYSRKELDTQKRNFALDINIISKLHHCDMKEALDIWKKKQINKDNNVVSV